MRKFRKQLYRHKPELEIMGDCYRTCFANILGLEPWEVPHFNLDPDLDATGEWLEVRRLNLFCFSCGGGIDNALEQLSGLAPGEIFILSGESRTRVNHAVLAKDGAIIHDPSLTDAGIIGPIIGTDYYSGEFLRPEMTKMMSDLLGENSENTTDEDTNYGPK